MMATCGDNALVRRTRGYAWPDGNRIEKEQIVNKNPVFGMVAARNGLIGHAKSMILGLSHLRR
jgi:hypothetical protein